MGSKPIEKEETKATRQHQITIPKKIWDKLGLKPGVRFQVILNDRHEIIIRPRGEELELTDEEWNTLMKLAHSEENVSRRFKGSKSGLSYLDEL